MNNKGDKELDSKDKTSNIRNMEGHNVELNKDEINGMMQKQLSDSREDEEKKGRFMIPSKMIVSWMNITLERAQDKSHEHVLKKGTNLIEDDEEEILGSKHR